MRWVGRNRSVDNDHIENTRKKDCNEGREASRTRKLVDLFLAPVLGVKDNSQMGAVFKLWEVAEPQRTSSCLEEKGGFGCRGLYLEGRLVMKDVGVPCRSMLPETLMKGGVFKGKTWEILSGGES